VHPKLARLLILCAFVLLLGITTGREPSARAEFPGYNGKIAFWRSAADAIDVFAYSNGTTTNLTNNPTDLSVISADPAWSPDGTKLALFNNGAIAVMNADGSGRTELTAEELWVAPDWSPDGTKIVFADLDIFVMNANGTGVVDITNTPGYAEEYPSWSPDGSKIAFSTNRDGNYEIYVSNPDGTSPTNLTNNAGGDGNPDWSPDSTKLVFSRDGSIYTMNADGSGQTQIASSGLAPVWSPDGSKILFTQNFGEITTMNTDGSGQTFVTYGYDASWQSSAVPTSGTINGTVYESPSGYMRGASLTLNPLGMKTTTSVYDGSFSFPNIPFGAYTITVHICPPYGCYGTVQVNHSTAKTYVAIYPTPNTPTPAPTPAAVGGSTKLAAVQAGRDSSWSGPGLALAAGVTAAALLAAGGVFRSARRRR
jgi:Tol biopolymer transport system component